MRPIEVEFQAFGPYVGHERVDFEAISKKGLFLICGKTGMGKTMILDAITFALYGKSSGHGRDDFEAMRCSNAEFQTTTFVKFDFENNGEFYRFERRLERRRKNLSPVYNVMKKEDGVWKPLFENAKEKALNEKAAEIIGLEYDQFRQVIVLPQGQFEKLLTSNSDEKEKILTNIFGEDRWQQIAEKFYEEAAARKDKLKEEKDRMINSLREESCESMEQLFSKIEEKKEELERFEEESAAAGYDTTIKEQQELLTIAARFGDLHRAEKKLQQLLEKKPEREKYNDRMNNARRAEAVRNLIEETAHCTELFETRKREEQEVLTKVETAEKKAAEAQRLLQDCLKQELDMEENKTRIIRYEEKRADYEGVETVKKELSEKKTQLQKAKKSEKMAEEAYVRYARELELLRQAYQKVNQEHGEFLEKYLAGITGELAMGLSEGAPCPVCGSTTHPKKALFAENSITRNQVDAKKKEADAKYKQLQQLLSDQNKADKVREERKKEAEQIQKELMTVETEYARRKQNFVEGIASLPELNDVIERLREEQTAYEEKKRRLQESEKAAGEACTDIRAKVEPAERERKNAGEQLEKAQQKLEMGLKENKFASREEAEALLADADEREKLQKAVADYDAAIESAEETLAQLKRELSGREEPQETECNRKIKEATDAKIHCEKQKGICNSELERLQKKAETLQAKGEGIEAEIREAEEDFAFAKKLRGDSGTGLQRYVLGIMFSSVVTAANKMLELVHGGRYRLYRSDEKAQGKNKRGLELKVFDKNSDNPEGRFVNTLSGGEKFLTSLALSIGMSAVAQKSGIKIEALFIDEGFGSLDEDSIGDAMNILNSIQAANGLVGIISHVQLLQDQIPTKLRVENTEKGSHIVQTIG